VRREESDVLAISVVAAFVASDHTDPLGRAVAMHERIRAEVDDSAAPDQDLEARRFDLHAQLVAAALSAGHDVNDAISVADATLAVINERDDGAS
jgi:hypothetical protein